MKNLEDEEFFSLAKVEWNDSLPTRALDLKARKGDGIIAFVLSALVVAAFTACFISGGYFEKIQIRYISDVGLLLPIAFFFCFLLGLWAVWSAKESRTVPVDWTDTDLILGYPTQKLIMVPWCNIMNITQLTDWDVINGKQPAFLIKGALALGFRFKLKQSDIMLNHDLESFFSAVRAHAPQAKLNLAPQISRTESYTELWLKYFSVETPRVRNTLLETKMRLKNDQYEVIETIGGGGQGTAYLAVYHTESMRNPAQTSKDIPFPNKKKLNLGEQLVLKEYVLPIHRGQAVSDRTIEKLKSEVGILSRLDHPRIVKLRDAFIEDYRGYLVLEYISGDSLKSIVGRDGAQPESQVIRWMIDACNTINYMHQLAPPVVHRDLSPDNLMLDFNGIIKIVDFNVAHQVDSSATATVVGKHAYIPPEQFRGKPSPPSDIYALGCTIFFLLTGRDPEPLSVSHPQTLNKNVTMHLDAIAAKATAYNLAERYQSVAEMAADLRALLTN